MKVIYGPRKSSRTTRLIEMCAEAEAQGNPSYIVCRDRHQVELIAQKAKELGLKIGFPITFDEFLSSGSPVLGRRPDRISDGLIFIDDADWLLQRISRTPIAAIVVEKRD